MEIEEIVKKEKAFYERTDFKFSYSSLKKLLWNPQAFYQMYVLGEREERTESYLVDGKVIHAILLEHDKFEENFIISPDNLPTGNTRQVVDRVFKHYQEVSKNGDPREHITEFNEAIIDVLKDMNLHQTLTDDKKTGVTGDFKRLQKIITAETMGYWNFMKLKGNKTLIDQKNYDFCKTAVEIVKTNNKIVDLLKIVKDDLANVDVENEITLECNIDEKPYGLKGIVDNLVIDHDKKIVYINDIKTTSKDLKDFGETVEFYGYWLQAAIYATLVVVKYQELFEKGYELKVNFVVIDDTYQVYAFPVQQKTLDEWFIRMNDVLVKAHWHYENKRYDLPYEFANDMITL